jgi:hypothetical protein
MFAHLALVGPWSVAALGWPPIIFMPTMRECFGQIETPRLLCGDRRCEMPRFSFHTRRGQMTVLDQQGFDLPDITHAEDEAKRRAQGIVASEAPKGEPATSGKIIVDDDNGQTVFELEF